MKRAVAPCLALAIAFGCREQQSVTSPESPRISADILDGAHGRGNTSFFFLPPMVAQPSFSGVFNPNLGPVVQICTLTVTGGGTVCDPSIAPINPGGVQVDPVGQKYQVNWNTGATNVSTTSTYRIQVFAANELLGFADVQPVINGSALKNLQTGDVIGLVDGRTLPIKFRIENGALCFKSTDCGEGTVGPAGGTIVSQNTLAGVQIPAGALANTVTVLVSQSSTVPCLPVDLAQSGGCYNFVTSPPGQFLSNVTVAICVDVEDFGTILAAHKPWFLLHRLDFVENQPVVTSLPNASAAFLPCNATETTPPPRLGVRGISRLLELARVGARRIVDFLTPQRAYAFHLGVGGSTCCFSQIGWALPAIMSKNAGDGQTAGVGTAVPTPPSVVLRDSGGTPIEGDTVRFTVGSGGGSVTGATQVTDQNGVATVGSWTLGSAAGTNTLIATSNGAVGSPQTFIAIAVASPDLLISTLLTATPLQVFPGDPIQLSAWTITNQGTDLNSPTGTIRNGFYLSTDTTITAADVFLDDNFNTNGVLPAGTSFQWGAPTLTIPANTAPGTYYLGILVDDLNQAVESNETNNFQSVKITVLSPLQ
jgi:CARDB